MLKQEAEAREKLRQELLQKEAMLQQTLSDQVRIKHERELEAQRKAEIEK